MTSAMTKPRTMKPPATTVRRATTRGRALGLVDLLHRMVRGRSELIVQSDEALELPTDLRDALLQLARALLHRGAADPEGDDLKIGEERIRRRRDHVPLLEVAAEIRLVDAVASHDLVV